MLDTFHVKDALAISAKLIADPARAAMLLKLMGGRTVPAGQLAIAAHVSPPTASEHLTRLTEAGFITVQKQGRHRYYQIANEEVADAVESLLVLSNASTVSADKAPTPAIGTFHYARTCYAHLAGWLGVAITDALQREGHLMPAEGRAFSITDRGSSWFAERGIAIPHSAKIVDAKLARRCLDWTERRHHLAGFAGVAMYKRFVELSWIATLHKSRTVRITIEGREAFLKYLHIAVG